MEGFPQENKKETTIKVSSELELTAENNGSGKKFKIADVLLTRSEQNDGVSYYSLDNLENTDDIKIQVNGEEINFPAEMKGRLSHFFKVQNSLPENFDCGSFAHLLNAIDYQDNTFYPENFNIVEMDSRIENSMLPGDTIFLSKTRNPNDYQVEHWAIYIGDGLYLSKFGGSGKLIVTDKKNMLKGFSAKYSFKATPIA